MTSRYALYEIETLRDRFQLPAGVPSGTKRHYNISPTAGGNVIILKDGQRTLERMKWGFIPQNAQDANSVFRYKTYVARSEAIFSKATWEKAVRHQRCLVPANGFYEWHISNNEKIPYFIHQRDETLFAMAGVYSSWTDPAGKEWGTYSIITIDSHSSSLHTKVVRPIVLSRADEALWLDPTIDDMSTLYSMMKSYTDDTLTIDRVSDKINSTKINTPELIVPVHTS